MWLGGGGSLSTKKISDRQIVLLCKAEREIEKARTIGEVKDIRDKAVLLRRYAARSGATKKSRQILAEIQLKAERKAGRLLGEMERDRGKGGDRKSRSQPATVKKLVDLGVSKSDSSRWQQESEVSEVVFRRYLAESKSNGGESSQSGLLSVARKVKGAVKRGSPKETKQESGSVLVRSLPDVFGKYRCIYADPPWAYRDPGVPGGGVSKKYKTMSVQEICKLPIGSLSHSDGSHLWLWTTWPMIRQRTPHEVLDAWGFEWKGEIVWKKVTKNWKDFFGVGRWLRPSTEVLILGVKKGEKKKKYISLVATGKELIGCHDRPVEGHSRKPDHFRSLIEKLSPGPRIELFARKQAKNWSRWGHEA